ncbi:N-acetylmuramic acid 6-phosphate etherase [Virgibacillus profundi]|uniref:N-acetylmuramic acid 6-phosphate etherase n=1 Tax=Virgibacillus profundi TaxID=2024555 RepID=A0A2A2IIR4_9BACI|nr:N-acetylmuramic acid 6-phosphate etherase [Virgibacillus profundi]PAV30973.1 N-acetylmuramic acid 6-phosphate etherase [Virgibacillus profundi]PXY55157.1 N-acetylmuramic acid 6-phosphate etherase [Virgibacillus profundi]
MNKIAALTTEMRNETSKNIDNMDTLDILTTINREDITVAQSVQAVIPQIKETVDKVHQAFKQGGRLFYIGAGTSGRIGVLDAVECPPTYSTPPDLVQAVIAGGNDAFVKAVEGAEDNEQLGANDLEGRNVTELDVVVGIAASGRTPYVVGALKYANEIGASTVSLSSNENAIISQHAGINIEVLTGPEVLTGSTRMKAATAHKLILNMITTTSMIKAGKVYENLMVDVKASNHKLKERAKSIVSTITEVTFEKAEEALRITNFEVKPAIVMLKTGIEVQHAKKYLNEANGLVRKAIELANKGEIE